ncbi:hypothetical protein PvtlMGM2_0776 [Prevotella sp. MGM2]|nr:hypothetical protein PvtlMGM2_0776 [Prevotella sp. MGM2]
MIETPHVKRGAGFVLSGISASIIGFFMEGGVALTEMPVKGEIASSVGKMIFADFICFIFY